MSKKELISIIMPAFNAERFIAESIKSVLSQTNNNWELLIVDDCSQDNTVNVVKEYLEKDARIKLYSNDKSSGPALTRNNAINHASGRFMAFLDADDIWLPEKLELQIDIMLKKGYAFTYTDYHRFSENGTITGHRITTPNNLNYIQLLRNTAIATSTVILDVQKVGEIKMKQTYYDDFVCWLEIMKRGHDAYRINEDLMEYRVTTSSVSRNKINSAKQVWNTYRSVEKLGLFFSVWCFIGYAQNAFIKYRTF